MVLINHQSALKLFWWGQDLWQFLMVVLVQQESVEGIYLLVKVVGVLGCLHSRQRSGASIGWPLPHFSVILGVSKQVLCFIDLYRCPKGYSSGYLKREGKEKLYLFCAYICFVCWLIVLWTFKFCDEYHVSTVLLILL